MTITEFLLARIAEDLGDHYRFQASDFGPPAEGEPEWYGCIPCGISSWMEDCQMQRECAAKRAIIVSCSAVDDVHDEYAVGLRDDTLRALAAVYSGHPDYQPEWKP